MPTFQRILIPIPPSKYELRSHFGQLDLIFRRRNWYNLLRDAVRKMIEWAACLSSEQQESLWRQSNYLQDQHKKRFHKARNLKRSTSSNENLEKLETFLDRAVLPKKGRWSEQDRKRERHPEFVRAMKKHSAVESDINALEQHGLDRCPDSGIDGYRRYVGLAVLGTNLHRLGSVLEKVMSRTCH